MEKLNVKIDGMSCNHCVMAVKMELKKLDLDSFDVKIGEAEISYDPSKVTVNRINDSIEEAGYKVVS